MGQSVTRGQTVEVDGSLTREGLKCQAEQLGLHSWGTGAPSVVSEQGRDLGSAVGGRPGSRE